MTTVLLIEDDQWLADMERSALEDEGYLVHHVSHGRAAIEAVDTYKPDVLVVDVLLSGGTAFALLHELRSYGDTAAIPVVLCTNLAEEFAPKTLHEYGVQRIVNKTTMHPSDLAAAVRAVL